MSRKKAPQKDKMLIKRARMGDSAAFESLFFARLNRLFSVAMHRTGNAEDAEDIVRETMLAAWKEIPAFQLGGCFDIWLLRILSRAIQTRY